MAKEYILNDRHQVLNVYSSHCGNCVHLDNGQFTCPAYPEGVPNDLLEGKRPHYDIIKGQTGKTVYEPINKNYNPLKSL